nr:olfactory receptor 14I1-like [Cavia porcellus]
MTLQLRQLRTRRLMSPPESNTSSSVRDSTLLLIAFTVQLFGCGQHHSAMFDLNTCFARFFPPEFQIKSCTLMLVDIYSLVQSKILPLCFVTPEILPYVSIMGNFTMIREFLLMDIASSRELQVLQGVFFFMIYLGSLAGNLVTIAVIVANQCLHSPMYFFISNLSLIDLCSISVIVPKSIINSLTGSNFISLKDCTAQVFLYIFFAFAELSLLVVMSYDRNVAICHPLHYGLIFTPSLCIQLVGGSWASGLIYSAIHTVTMFRLPFTKSSVIHQYFCDVSQILRVSSSDVQFAESVVLMLSVCVIFACFVFLFMTYINIFSTVFKMRFVEARHKAISTCVPQLAVLFYF